MFEFLGAIFGGGITGLIGTIFTEIMGFFREKQKFKQKIAMRKLDIELADKEYSHESSMATLESETRVTESGDDLRERSYEYDDDFIKFESSDLSGGQRWIALFVYVLRKIIRPALTIYLIYCVWATRAEVRAVLDQFGGPDFTGLGIGDVTGLYKQVIDTILYLASTCITWWFGSRVKSNK